MSEILDAPIVLRLNHVNQRIGFSTVREAFAAMMGGEKGSPPYLALDIEYELDAEGKPLHDQMVSFRRVGMDEWKTLPIRPWDLVINGVRGPIRVPTVVVCPHFSKMPKKKLAPKPNNIRNRDGNRCQYTGVPLTKKTFSLDHVVPRSKGGKDSWENLVACHRDVNSKKGDRYNHEVGLKLLKQPTAPREIPLCALYTDIKHPDHAHF